MILLDLGNVDLDLVVANILIGAEHQVQECGKNHDCHDGEEVEANLTGDQAADLVHDQSRAVSQSAHITDGDGSPLAVVHLTLDRAHSSEAGSAQQVEDHKGVSGQSGVILRNCCPDLITVLRQLAAEVIQNTEGANHVLLCDQTRDGSNGCTPVAEAQRSEDPGDLGSDSGQDGVVLILDHAEGTILETEALQEPQHNGSCQNDGTGTLDEGPAALPGGTENVAPCRHMVSGQLHNEGCGVASEELGLLQNNTGANDGSHADEVSGNSNQRGWGESGANGAECLFTAENQEMQGDVVWDSISQLDFYMTDGSTLTGAVTDDESNAGEGGDGYCNLYIGEGCTWTVTGDSTLTSLSSNGTITDEDGNAVTVKGTDGTVYVEGESSYTVTVASYSDTADLSGASSTTQWSDYETEKPEALA